MMSARARGLVVGRRRLRSGELLLTVRVRGDASRASAEWGLEWSGGAWVPEHVQAVLEAGSAAGALLVLGSECELSGALEPPGVGVVSCCEVVENSGGSALAAASEASGVASAPGPARSPSRELSGALEPPDVGVVSCCEVQESSGGSSQWQCVLGDAGDRCSASAGAAVRVLRHPAWRLVRASPGAGLLGVERVLAAARCGDIAKAQAAIALGLCSSAELEAALALEEGSRELKAKVQAVARRLKGMRESGGRVRAARIDSRDVALLAAAETALAPLYDVVHVACGAERALALEPLERPPEHTYAQQRKAPQVRWMLEQALDMLGGCASALVIDVGCGRGELTLNLAHALPHCRVVGLDINAAGLETARSRAAQRGLANVTFVLAGVQELLEQPAAVHLRFAAETSKQDSADSVGASDAPTPTLVVGLHACGGLSEAILELALRLEASALCATCCFTKNAHLARSAQERSALGFVQVNRRVLVLAEINEDPAVSQRAMRVVNNVRIKWALALRPRGQAALLAFDRNYSPKNQVLRWEHG